MSLMLNDQSNDLSKQQKRDNAWLKQRLDDLWANYFSDVEVTNPVVIRFGRYSKYRLGSIRLNRKSKISQITITGMFKKLSIDSRVVDQTIAHELCHYAHGFSSFRPRLHKYPHYGGVINKELRLRGLEALIRAYSKWVKEYRLTL